MLGVDVSQVLFPLNWLARYFGSEQLCVEQGHLVLGLVCLVSGLCIFVKVTRLIGGPTQEGSILRSLLKRVVLFYMRYLYPSVDGSVPALIIRYDGYEYDVIQSPSWT